MQVCYLQYFSLDSRFFLGFRAVAGSDYSGRSNVLLTFNAATRSREVPVVLLDDSVFEGEEDFIGIIASDSSGVNILFEEVLAIIDDDEGVSN